MSLSEKMSGQHNMYSENVYFPDVFKGCLHDCVYCRPSFQRQAKRQRSRCQKCYDFIPHNHFERIRGSSPITEGKQFVFFPKGGDVCFAQPQEIRTMLRFARLNPQTTFLMQTKNPQFLWDYIPLPDNLIVGTTLETTCSNWAFEVVWHNPSRFKWYSDISKAPVPRDRKEAFLLLQHTRKAVTIEPILQFSLLVFIQWIKMLHPEFVYIGYDNHNCHLPEPSLADTKLLIDELQKFTDVRLKTIRKAWWE